MKKIVKSYTYRIIIEPDGKRAFHGYVPALPGCHTWGETLEETRRNVRDAIDTYLRVLVADGDAVPEDRGVEMMETVLVRLDKRSPSYA